MPLIQIGKGHLVAGGWTRGASSKDIAVIDLTGTQYSRTGEGPIKAENDPALEAFENTINSVTEKPLPWLSLYIQDFHVPYFEDKTWKTLAQDIITITKSGTDVLVACTGGHGRTGLTTSILLGLLAPDIVMPDPIGWLRKNYCDNAVETWEQHKYVHSILGVEEPEINDYTTISTNTYTYGYDPYDTNYLQEYSDPFSQTKFWKKANTVDGVSLADLAELLQDSGYWYEYNPNAEARHQLAVKVCHTGVMHYVDNCIHEDEIILFSGDTVGLDDLEWLGDDSDDPQEISNTYTQE